MILSEALTEAYRLATGKPVLPAAGSSKYGRLLGHAKKAYRDWQHEKGIDWNSLYDIVGAGTVTNTNTFSLDTEILKVSQREGDFITIQRLGDGGLTKFALVPASKLSSGLYTNNVSHIGKNVKFSRTFVSTDQEFGGTIYVPAYVKLADLSDLDDEILIDDPDWHPLMTAALYVMTDAQLNYLYPDLLSQANEKMSAMKLANGSQVDDYVASENFFDVGLGPYDSGYYL